MPNGAGNKQPTITNHGDKIQLLNGITSAINSAIYLQAICDQNGDNVNSAKYDAVLVQLNQEYTDASQAILQDWLGDANTVKTAMQSATEQINACVKDVQNDVNTANQVVDALGYLDQAVQIAAKLIK